MKKPTRRRENRGAQISGRYPSALKTQIRVAVAGKTTDEGKPATETWFVEQAVRAQLDRDRENMVSLTDRERDLVERLRRLTHERGKVVAAIHSLAEVAERREDLVDSIANLAEVLGQASHALPGSQGPSPRDER